MKLTLPCFLSALLLAACTAAGPNLPPARSVISLKINGTARSYILRFPKAYDGKPDHKLPMVMLLNGANDSAAYAEKAYHFDEKSDQQNFILVLPDALGDYHAWDSSGDSDDSKNDLAFLTTLLTDLPKTYAIDPKRVYLAGHSAGAIMTYRMACEHPELISAIGIVAGLVGDFPKPMAPVPIIAFHGKLDQTLPYEGMADALIFWAKINRCNPKPTHSEIVKEYVTRDTYTPTDKVGAEMVAYSLDDGNHMWPGGNKMPGKTIDPVQDISATDLMWDFFKAHPRP